MSCMEESRVNHHAQRCTRDGRALRACAEPERSTAGSARSWGRGAQVRSRRIPAARPSPPARSHRPPPTRVGSRAPRRVARRSLPRRSRHRTNAHDPTLSAPAAVMLPAGGMSVHAERARTQRVLHPRLGTERARGDTLGARESTAERVRSSSPRARHALAGSCLGMRTPGPRPSASGAVGRCVGTPRARCYGWSPPAVSRRPRGAQMSMRSDMAHSTRRLGKPHNGPDGKRTINRGSVGMAGCYREV